MMKQGEAIVHPSRGAGIINEIKEMTLGDTTRKYYNIALISGGTLMVPVEQAEEAGILPVSDEFETIVEVLSEKPEELNDNFRQRQARMNNLISSGNPAEVAQALRDLAWRNHCSRLSTGDLRLMSRAKSFLVSIMAVKPNLDFESAQQRLDAVITKNINSREVEVSG